MDNSLREKFSRVWNVDLVIDYIECLANIQFHGHVKIERIKDNDYHNLLKERLDSVLSAYGRCWRPRGRGLIGKMSEDKQKELFSLISDNENIEASDKMISRIIDAQKFFDFSEEENLNYDSGYSVGHFFSYLLYIYVSLCRINDPFHNMVECSHSVGETCSYISRSILSSQKELLDKIKRILVLMMGDDFDKEISEVELIEKYGYPEVTDEELHNMRIEYES